jgi:hypothetical protein
VETGALRRETLELSAGLLMGMMREVIMLDVETQHPSTPEQRASEVLSIFIDGAGVR